ncbi:Ger(x)C family spore germination protein [Brevibacillus fluminis]|uniref:Ger(x)C family spore germination protein n=1 Tax=Brevibacillus fluminis TaxID=511487 RepID=UPI003F8BDB07
MAYRHKIAFVLLLCSTLLLGGCWNSKEIEHLRYPTALGIDYRNNQYEIYLQLVDISVIAKMEGGGRRTGQEMVVLKGVGRSFDEAAFNIYSFTQQRVNWSHIRAVIFGEGALKLGLDVFLDNFSRYGEFRHTWWTFTAQSNVKDLLLLYPTMNTPAIFSQLGDPTTVFRQSSYIQPVMLNRFEAQLYEKSVTTILPRLSTQNEKVYTTSKLRKHPVLTRNGVCVLSKRKWLGCLSVAQASGLRWMSTKTVRTPVNLFEGKNPIADLVFEDPRPTITYRMKDGKPYFTIKVETSGSLSDLNQQTSVSKLEKESAKLIEKQIRDTYLHGLKMHADIFSFSRIMYRQNVKLWKTLQKDGQLQLTPASLEKIEVKATLKNSGELKFVH